MPTSGDKLKEARIEKGLTLQQLGKLIGVSHATLSKYESGDIENIPPNRIEDLARVLEVSPSYLMGWEDAFVMERNLVKQLIDHTKKENMKWTAPTNPNCDFSLDFTEYCETTFDTDEARESVMKTSFISRVFSDYYLIYSLKDKIVLCVLRLKYADDSTVGDYLERYICNDQEVSILGDLYNLISGGSKTNKASYLEDLLENLDCLESNFLPPDGIPF